MDQETQTGSEGSEEAQGTTEEGQSTETQQGSSQANDPTSFQADYTRKYQELSEQRQAFEQERQAFEQQRNSYQQQSYGQNYNQGYSQAPQQQQGQSNQDYVNKLVETLGYEGAEAVIKANEHASQSLKQTQFNMLYAQKGFEGKQKYGEEWEKYNYFDPQTGMQRNKVLDKTLYLDVFTGKPLSMDEAWNATNHQDMDKVKQQIRDEIYAEIQRKEHSTPASQSNANPGASGEGHATSIAEAFAQAEKG